jgi:hypothetical protein
MENDSLELWLAKYWANNPETFSSGNGDIYLSDLLYFVSDVSPIFVINVTVYAINLMDKPDDAIMPVFGPMLDILLEKPDSVEDVLLQLIDSNKRFSWAISNLYRFRPESKFIDELFVSRDLGKLIGTDMPSYDHDRGSD